MAETRILAQDCWVETWHNQQELSSGEVPTGEEVIIFSANGYRTVVRSLQEREDEFLVQYGFEDDDATEVEIEAARTRLEREDYGPLFVSEKVVPSTKEGASSRDR